jgi:hypothetical protein
LAALSDAVTRSLDSIRWPSLASGLQKDVEMRSISPCTLVSQDRFFAADERNLTDLFGLQETLDACKHALSEGPVCSVCRGPLARVTLPELTAALIQRLGAGALLSVFAPLASPGPQIRRRWMRLGYHRFWMDDQVADSEDIDASSGWTGVKAVLVDSITLDEGAGERFMEAAMTVHKMAGTGIMLRHRDRNWTIDPGGLFCPACLTTRLDGAPVDSDRFDPTVAGLMAWLTALDGERGLQNKKASALDLLNRFGFADSALSQRLDDFTWADRGLLLLLRAAVDGGAGRFILADAPFRGLETVLITALTDYMEETSSSGWGWIIASDGGILQGRALERPLGDPPSASSCEAGLVGPGGARPRLGTWRGTLSFRGGAALDVQSGQWQRLDTIESGQNGWNLRDWTFTPDPQRPRELPMLRVAGHRQAWKMAQGRRQSLAGCLGWDRLLAERFALMPQSRSRGLDAARLLGRHPLGACIACRGLGQPPDGQWGRWTHPCPACQGTGMRREEGAPQYHQLTLYDIMNMTVRDLDGRILFSSRLLEGAGAAMKLGFADAVLSRRIWTFSDSERWLLLLLSQLTQFSHTGLWVIEQPWLGLSPNQQRALDDLMEAFTLRGGSLVTLGRKHEDLR